MILASTLWLGLAFGAAASPLQLQDPQAMAFGAPVESTMLVCDGGSAQNCQMRCLLKYKRCHGGDGSQMQRCREEVLDPCNQQCERDCH